MDSQLQKAQEAPLVAGKPKPTTAVRPVAELSGLVGRRVVVRPVDTGRAMVMEVVKVTRKDMTLRQVAR